MKIERRGLLFFAVLLLSFLALMVIWKNQQDGSLNPSQNSLFKFLNQMEHSVSDLKFRARSAEKAPGVMIAKIDEASLQKYGRWPWPRAIFQEVLQKLYDAGAELVAFDAVFSEPEFNEKVLRSYFDYRIQEKSLKEKLNLQALLLDKISKELPRVGDEVFSAALKEYPQTVLGYIWEERRGCNLGLPDAAIAQFDEKKVPQNSFDEFEREMAGRAKNRMIEGLGRLLGSGISIADLESFTSSNANKRFPSTLLKDCSSANTAILARNAPHRGFF